MTHKLDMQALARRGAEITIRELVQQFPGLTVPTAPTRQTPTPTRKRPAMTRAQKRAVSVRMKRYWATRRKGQTN